MNIHLTNFAINRTNPAYVSNKGIEMDSYGHKRSLKSAYENLKKSGCDLDRLHH